MKNVLLVVIICFTVHSLSVGKSILTSTNKSKTSKKIIEKPRKGHTASPWRRHGKWPICPPGGIYCRHWCGFDTDVSSFKLESDETLGETNISLVGNNITITTIGIKGNLSDRTIAEFRDNKVSPTEDTIPMEMLNDLFELVKINPIKESITFSPDEQSYEVIKTRSVKGKQAFIVEVTQAKKVIINGKSFFLKLITTSGQKSNLDNVSNIPTSKEVNGLLPDNKE
jgi:hypothetical protein